MKSTFLYVVGVMCVIGFLSYLVFALNSCARDRRRCQETTYNECVKNKGSECALASQFACDNRSY